MNIGFQDWSVAIALPDGLEHLPRDYGGIYSFIPRLPSNAELGFSEARLTTDAVRSNLSNWLARLLKCYGGVTYRGRLSSERKGLHLRQVVDIEAKGAPLAWIELSVDALLEDIPDRERLLMICAMIRGQLNRMPPLYLGMAKEQSIWTRVSQHCRGETGFYKRLRSAGLDIRDLECRYFPISAVYKADLRNFEVILQQIALPILSED